MWHVAEEEPGQLSKVKIVTHSPLEFFIRVSRNPVRKLTNIFSRQFQEGSGEALLKTIPFLQRVIDNWY